MNPQVKFCTKCGTPNPAGTLVCPKCGAPSPGTVFLNSLPAAQPPPAKKKRGARFWLGILLIASGTLGGCLSLVTLASYFLK